jgi:ATP-dependent DNA helicase RecG
MNESGIHSLLLETSGTSFEACRSLEQDLTFMTLKEEVDKRQIAFGSAQMETLLLRASHKIYD